MRLKVFICVLLAGVTLMIYWPARHYGIVFYDDPLFVMDNPEINAGLTWHSVWWAVSSVLVANWHPVTSLSFVVTHQLWGLNPGAEHLVNLLFHAANAALLFLVLNRMTKTMWRSAMVAAIFAWHPLRVESVAWIAERKDVLCGFFLLLALLCWARFTQSKVENREADVKKVAAPDSRPPMLACLLALVCFALSLMSKPMAVTLPFLLLLLDVWPLRRFTMDNWRSRTISLIREKIPFFVLSAVFCALTYEIQKNFAAVISFDRLGLDDRVCNALVSYVDYLGKFFWPAKLAVIYPYAKDFDPVEVSLAALLLLAISILCVRQISRRPYLFTGWFWFLVAMGPVIGLVQVGPQAMADRYTYLPLIGPALGLVWLFAEGTEKFLVRRIPVAAASVFALVVSAIAARQQVELWHDTVSLFRHTVAVTANNPAAEYGLGAGYEHAGQTNAAMAQYIIAAKMNSADTQPRYALAQLLREQGDLAAAAEEYEAVLQIKPDDTSSRLNLARTLQQMGKTDEAVFQLETALQFAPNSIEALNNLAWLLATNPDPRIRNGPRAVQLAEHACELTDYQKTILVGTLAAACAEAGQFDDAVAMAQKAIALARQSGKTELAAKNRELLELYRAHKAYHETAAEQNDGAHSAD
jgi:protein O-mannosyl-transferase